MQPLLQQGCFFCHGSVAMGTVGEQLWFGIGFYDSLRQRSLPSLYKDPTSLLQALLESGPLGKASILSFPALWSSIQETVLRLLPWCKPCVKPWDKTSHGRMCAWRCGL